MSETNRLPHFACGLVVNGFGRGSKELGIPTANFTEEVVANLPESVAPGVYYGLARVTDGPVYKAVMSVGWNPYYNNTKKSMETHILHEFGEDFYGQMLRVAVLGYIRPETSFSSLDALITAIKDDIAMAHSALDAPQHVALRQHAFLTAPYETLQSPVRQKGAEANGATMTNGTVTTASATLTSTRAVASTAASTSVVTSTVAAVPVVASVGQAVASIESIVASKVVEVISTPTVSSSNVSKPDAEPCQSKLNGTSPDTSTTVTKTNN